MLDQQQEERPAPPEHLKPWYYQYWFLYPVVVFWPVWAVLIIRSPWHNGLPSGALAWAMLFCGGYLVVYRQVWLNRDLNDFTITILIPGLILTVVTQALWTRDRPRIRRLAAQSVETSSPDHAAESPDNRGRPRKRSRRRSGSRSRR